jgi:hypothetical protein
MTMTTYHVVQSYTKVKTRLSADTPFYARDLEQARRVAERLAESKPMVVAMMGRADAETGEYEEPRLIFAHGDNLPEEIESMERA